MPRIDELPMPAQNELRAHRGEAADGGASLETKRMTLLQRLAHIGMGQKTPAAEKKDDAELPSFLKPRDTATQSETPVTKPADRKPPQEVSEYFKRSAPTRSPAIEPAARTAPSHIEEDELEIPAFLRRQAN